MEFLMLSAATVSNSVGLVRGAVDTNSRVARSPTGSGSGELWGGIGRAGVGRVIFHASWEFDVRKGIRFAPFEET